MDSRKMRKHMLALALRNFLQTGSLLYELEMALDDGKKEIIRASPAQLARWKKNLQEMVDNAESKLK